MYRVMIIVGIAILYVAYIALICFIFHCRKAGIGEYDIFSHDGHWLTTVSADSRSAVEDFTRREYGATKNLYIKKR